MVTIKSSLVRWFSVWSRKKQYGRALHHHASINRLLYLGATKPCARTPTLLRHESYRNSRRNDMRTSENQPLTRTAAVCTSVNSGISISLLQKRVQPLFKKEEIGPCIYMQQPATQHEYHPCLRQIEKESERESQNSCTFVRTYQLPTS